MKTKITSDKPVAPVTSSSVQEVNKRPLIDDRPEVEKIYSLTASRDADEVKAAIIRKYGENWYNEPRYFNELIDFVEALTDGQQ